MSENLVPDSITKWLGNLDRNGDVLLLRNVYIDLCDGDHLAALIFSQLLYWHLPDKRGTGSKLRVHKDGHWWVARTHKDWMEECRINEYAAEAKIGWLKSEGLVVTKCFMFNGFRTLHLRIDFDRLLTRVNVLNLLQPVQAETSNRLPANHRNRWEQITATGQTPQPGPITETTTTTTAKKSRTTPKSSPDEDFSDDLRANGRKDWLALAREDSATDLILDLFPEDSNTPLESVEVARKFVRRRGGILGGNAALLLAKMFSKARYEGMEVPEWRRCRTYSALLEAKNLAPALEACRLAASESLEEIRCIEDLATDISPAIQLMRLLDNHITAETDLVHFCSGRSDIPVCCSLAYRKQHPQLSEVHRVHADTINECLSRELYWSQLHGSQFAEVFGIDENKTKIAQEAWMASLDVEKAEMEMLFR